MRFCYARLYISKQFHGLGVILRVQGLSSVSLDPFETDLSRARMADDWTRVRLPSGDIKKHVAAHCLTYR